VLDFTSFIVLQQHLFPGLRLWFTMRTRAVESTTEEVDLYLVEKGVKFERAQKITGRSGRVWQPDVHTRSSNHSSLVYVLSTGGKAAARRVTEHVVTAWHDINSLKVGPEALRFVSLFDDSMDVWSSEEFRLLEDISEIARWSQPDAFLDILSVPASVINTKGAPRISSKRFVLP
jgi:hypothetical protein